MYPAAPRVVRSPGLPSYLGAVYAAKEGAAVVLIPVDASAWEERVAVRIATERAAESGHGVYASVLRDELPPRPRLLA